MRLVIGFMNVNGIKTIMCCCGHGKYPMSIICKDNLTRFTMEIFSGYIFKDRKRFYKKDKQGYYHIPQLFEAQKPLAVNKKEDDGLPPTDKSVGIRPVIL